jgi:hypothetical protein
LLNAKAGINLKVCSLIAGESGALLDREFPAHDLPKMPIRIEKASEPVSEAI